MDNGPLCELHAGDLRRNAEIVLDSWRGRRLTSCRDRVEDERRSLWRYVGDAWHSPPPRRRKGDAARRDSSHDTIAHVATRRAMTAPRPRTHIGDTTSAATNTCDGAAPGPSIRGVDVCRTRRRQPGFAQPGSFASASMWSGWPGRSLAAPAAGVCAVRCGRDRGTRTFRWYPTVNAIRYTFRDDEQGSQRAIQGVSLPCVVCAPTGWAGRGRTAPSPASVIPSQAVAERRPRQLGSR